MASSSNIFASNVFYSGNVFGPSGEQLTQAAALTQKIQDLAGGFSNGIPGVMSSTCIVGTGMAQSTLSPFTNALEGSIYFPGTSSNYISTGGAGSSITAVNWATVSGGFTLELWANFPSFTNASTDATSFPVMIGNINNPGIGGGAYFWGFGPTTSGVLYFSYYNGSSIQVTSSTTLSTNTWYHLCVQSNGTNIFQFVNGTLASTTAISGAVQVGTGNPLTLGASYTRNPGPTMYIASARLTYGANLYSQGSFTTPTGPLDKAPTGQTVMLLRNPLYSSMTLRNPLNAQSSVRVRCLPSDALIYLDAFGSNVPNKGGGGYSPPSFDPYGSGAVLYRASTLNSSNFGTHYISVSSKGFTVMFKIQLALGQNNNEQIFNISATSYIVFVRNGTTNQFNVAYSANGSSQTTVGTITINQDVTAVVAVRYDPRTTLWTVWLNGAIGASGVASANQPLDFNTTQMTIGYNMNMNLYTFAVYNRALTDNEITDASATLSQVAPVVPNTVEIGNVNGRPALTVDPTGAVNILGPLNGAPGGYAPVELGINSMSLASGNLTSNIAVTSFSPLGSSEGSLYFPGVANTYIQLNNPSVTNANIYSYGDFLIESWVNPSSTSNGPTIFAIGGAANFQSTQSWLWLASGGYLYWTNGMHGTNQTVYSTNAIIPLNIWTHVAVIYQSSSRRLQLYVNGQPQPLTAASIIGSDIVVSGTVATFSYWPPSGSGFPFSIGQSYASGSQYQGYLTNLRVVTGSGASQIYNNNAFVPSTSPLFPASNASTGSLTTSLLVRVPRAPGQVQIQKFMGAAATGFSGVQAFPPAPMTGYSTNMSGLTPYGQGTYVASASSEVNTLYLAWYAFDQIVGNWWTSAIQYNGSPPYNYTGTTATVDVNGNSYLGEWIQIQLPSAIIPSSYTITQAGGGTNQQYSPTKFWILGSRDGTSWSLVDFRTGAVAPWAAASPTFTVTASQAFSYFRLVANILLNNGTACSLSQIIFNGTIEGPSVSADGRLGIGVSNPVQALEVAGTSVVYGDLVSNGSKNYVRWVSTNGTAFPQGQATNRYYKIATLSATGDGGGGARLMIRGYLNPGGLGQGIQIDSYVQTRTGLIYGGISIGRSTDVTSRVDILIYLESNSTYSIYLKTYFYFTFDLAITGETAIQGGLTVFPCPSSDNSIAAPTGTLQSPSLVVASNTITTTSGGSVGINTSSPVDAAGGVTAMHIRSIPGSAYTLHLDSSGQSQNAGIRINAATAATPFVDFLQGGTYRSAIYWDPTPARMHVNSAFNVNGALTKTSGTFDIDHPALPEPKRLCHSFIEGPRCDLIYRGSVQLVNGTATVNIDAHCTSNAAHAMSQGTFEALCANPVCFLQNDDSFDRVKGKVSGNILVITCENAESSDGVNWMVVAERKDSFIKQWNRTDPNGFLIPEYDPPQEPMNAA